MKVNHLNALLVEIIMAVLFFALAATVILQGFTAAHDLDNRAEVQTAALNQAQNLAERLYASQDMEKMLAAEQFIAENGVWRLTSEDFTLCVQLESEPAPAGVLQTASVTAICADQILVQLPCVRYDPEVAA